MEDSLVWVAKTPAGLWRSTWMTEARRVLEVGTEFADKVSAIRWGRARAKLVLVNGWYAGTWPPPDDFELHGIIKLEEDAGPRHRPARRPRKESDPIADPPADPGTQER